MPRRKRYFPVSHDINDDPEVWELTEMTGVSGLRSLLEVLSILDKTENKWKDTEQAWKSVFTKCGVGHKSRYKVLTKLVQLLSLSHWTDLQSPSNTFYGARNYWKYHNSEEPKGIQWVSPPITITITSPLSKKKESWESTSSTASPVVKKSVNRKRKGDFMAGMNLIPELKEIGDMIYYRDRDRYKKIAAWIGQGRKNGYPEVVMAEALRRCNDQPIFHEIPDWWGYADNVLEKVLVDSNRDASLAEHEAHKRDFDKVPKGG